MANKSFEEDVGAIFIGFVSLTLMLVAIVTAFWLAIPVAGILCIYAGYRMYQNSDAVQERKAHELTHRLYAETKALAPAIPEAKDFAGQVYRAIPAIASETRDRGSKVIKLSAKISMSCWGRKKRSARPVKI